MNIYIKFFSFLIVLFFQCFTSDWPQDTHFTEFSRQTALLRKALAFKMYGTFDVFMDPKTGLPADSTKRSEVEALSIFDIQEATLGLEHFIGSLEVQIKYDRLFL